HREPPRDARAVPVIELDLPDPPPAQALVEQADEVEALLQLGRAATDREFLRNHAHAIDRGLVERDELEVRAGAPPNVGRPRQVLEMRAKEAFAEPAVQQAFNRILRCAAAGASRRRIERGARRRIRFGHDALPELTARMLYEYKLTVKPEPSARAADRSIRATRSGRSSARRTRPRARGCRARAAATTPRGRFRATRASRCACRPCGSRR